MSKKTGLMLGASILFGIIAISLVSAVTYDPRSGMQDLIDFIVNFFEPLLQVLLGGGTWDGYLLFEKLILFVLVLAITYLALNQIEIFEENPTVLWIIAIAMPLIGVRFINFEWLNTIIIQYKIVAIAFTAGLPFIIYTLFLYTILEDYKNIRKIAWIFFIVIYLGLWTTGDMNNSYPEIYLWTAILAILLFLFDGTISRHLLNQKLEEGQNSILASKYLKTQKELADTIGLPESKIRDEKVKKLEKELKYLQKHLSE